MPHIKKDLLLSKLEKEVAKLLADDDIAGIDRIKIIDAGVKLLAIRHKITDAASEEGSFFADK